MTEENITNEINEEILSVSAEEEPTDTDIEEKNLDQKIDESAENDGKPSEASVDEGGEDGACEENADVSAEDFAKILANPMFAVFARGRNGDIASVVRDFSAMMEAGRGLLTDEAKMKMTPGTGFAGGQGIALSERQRKIARGAGMSYREYYDLICALPEKNKR